MVLHSSKNRQFRIPPALLFDVMYHHRIDTIRQLWDTVPYGEWEFSSELVRHVSEGWENGGMYLQDGDEQKKPMYFSSRIK